MAVHVSEQNSDYVSKILSERRKVNTTYIFSVIFLNDNYVWPLEATTQDWQ